MASVGGDTTCTIHPLRQSSARCPSCGNFFCAECITEHDGRLICAGCLSAEKKTDQPRRRFRFPVAALLQLVIAAILCWAVYYAVGRTLSDVPDEFHDGTIWE